MVKIDIHTEQQSDPTIGDNMSTEDNEELGVEGGTIFKQVWGGNKIRVQQKTREVMRGWAGILEEHPTIIGVGDMTHLIHLATVLSLEEEDEPPSLNDLEEKVEIIANIQAIDRIQQNEIHAIELLLKSRYNDSDVSLIERFSAHLQRGMDKLQQSMKKLVEPDVTILDILKETSPQLFKDIKGITPIQSTFDDLF